MRHFVTLPDVDLEFRPEQVVITHHISGRQIVVTVRWLSTLLAMLLIGDDDAQ